VSTPRLQPSLKKPYFSGRMFFTGRFGWWVLWGCGVGGGGVWGGGGVGGSGGGCLFGGVLGGLGCWWLAGGCFLVWLGFSFSSRVSNDPVCLKAIAQLCERLLKGKVSLLIFRFR